jgi:hypothetical protein
MHISTELNLYEGGFNTSSIHIGIELVWIMFPKFPISISSNSELDIKLMKYTKNILSYKTYKKHNNHIKNLWSIQKGIAVFLIFPWDLPVQLMIGLFIESWSRPETSDYPQSSEVSSFSLLCYLPIPLADDIDLVQLIIRISQSVQHLETLFLLLTNSGIS